MAGLGSFTFTATSSASVSLLTTTELDGSPLAASAASSASVTLDGFTATSLGALAFTGTSAAGVTLTRVHVLELAFSGTSAARVVLPKSYGLDVTTGRPAYRVVLLSSATGAALGEVESAKLGTLTDVLNGVGSFSFSVASADPKSALCQPVKTEVQVWRGGQVEWWGVIVRVKDDGRTVEVQCQSLLWWLTRRVVGKIPRDNLLYNGDFDLGLAGWSFGYLEGSVPAAPPVHYISGDSLTGMSSLLIAGSSQAVTTTTRLDGDVSFEYNSANLTSAGEAALDELAGKVTVQNPTFGIEGHTDSTGTSSYNLALGLARANSVRDYLLGKIPAATITTSSAGETQPIATNATPAGRALNRRVEIAASYTETAYGNRQYAAQSRTYTNSDTHRRQRLTLVGWYKVLSWTDPGIGYGAALETRAADGTLIAAANVELDAASPVASWIRQECSVEVEPGATVTVTVRLHPPSGTVVWDSVTLTEDTATSWWDADQATIAAGLVAHAQDPAMGKSDLRIGTRCPATGVRRSRTYPWAERRPVAEALDALTTQADGVDLAMEWTPTTRTLATYYPRKGSDTDYVLALGSNMIGYDNAIDGELTASTLVVQSPSGSGSGREEGVVQDASLLDGVVLESIYQGAPYSSVGSLTSQARTGWERYSRPVSIPQPVMAPSYTTELLDTLSTGDRVRVVIPRGLVPIDGTYRIVGWSLDPAADQLTYTLAQEV